ncbi:hypothetical protein AB0346_18650 [Nocardia beijingensis]|uniref:hypothetical protein n=1 Tax=Nocardia beijingensis TaxID=95162 RepID=UPI00344C6377
MTDSSLLGYGTEPQEVDLVYDDLIGARDGEDVLHRYFHVSSRQALLLAVSDRLADERALLAAELYDDLGEARSYSRLAAALGCSRSKAQQLIARARDLSAKSGAQSAAQHRAQAHQP